MYIQRKKHNRLSSLAVKRQGSLYISILGVTLIVSLIGFTAMSVARTQLKIAQEATDLTQAQHLAFSGLEYAALKIAEDSNWRTNFVHGTTYPDSPILIGDGEVTFQLLDEDSDLSDNTSDPVQLVAIGRVRDVAFSESVTLYPSGSSFTCLETALHCVGEISLAEGVEFTSNQIISSNGAINSTANNSTFNSEVETVSTFTGNINGVPTTGVAIRSMPVNYVTDYYELNGTWIDIDVLPLNGSNQPVIQNLLLSPAQNPLSNHTNLEGIYVIDCEGQDIVIQNCRIVGTLVLKNMGTTATIDGSVIWEAAVDNYPSLMVDGNLQFKYSEEVLSESSIGANLNPAGTPYSEDGGSGESDSDQSDQYPSVIKGLIYVSGQLSLPADLQTSKVEGAIVCTTINAASNLTVDYYNTYRDYPPPGFKQGPGMAMYPGSRRRETITE